MVSIGSFFEEVGVVGLISRSLQDDISSKNSADAAAQDYDDSISERQEVALAWMLRIAGIVSFVSGIYIFLLAWKRRGYVYHRLMLGK